MTYSTRNVLSVNVATEATTNLAGEPMPYGSGNKYPDEYADGVGMLPALILYTRVVLV